jgi:ethylmalonyl-CoA/methylmalonyl-CoA decarboxylase
MLARLGVVRGAGALLPARGRHVRSLFAFVNDADRSGEEVVARSRETLRRLGRHDQHVVLHLPFSPSPAGKHGVEEVPASPLPLGYRALKRTAVIEIHNPSARNALSGKMMAELADIVTVLETEDVHRRLNAVVLIGTEGWFCAGADLRVAKQALSSREAGTAMGALMVDTLTRFRRLPLVSVACIEGGAYGGGAELATACDFRLMSSSAVIQFVQARMGVSPGWGGGARLYKIVGRQAALRLLCTAEKLPPSRALELQLADEVFDVDETACVPAICSFLTPFDSIAPGSCMYISDCIEASC